MPFPISVLNYSLDPSLDNYCAILSQCTHQSPSSSSPSDTDMARVQRTAKRCRITLENSATCVARNTEVGAIEEVTAEADTIEEPEVKTVTMSSQTYQSGVTKTSETGSDSFKIPLFSLRMFIGDNDTIHYYKNLETYETLLFVLITLGPKVHVLNYMYGTISQTEVVDQFFLVLMKLR